MKKGEPAKYMNSPETQIYHKSRILYGMHVAKTAIRDAGAAVLVEGYFDMLSLYQAGIENVVAVSGTAFTNHQARLIARYAPKAYLFFDADSAGRNAALKSVEVFFNAGIEPIIVTPPKKQDPDSLVRDIGGDGVRELFEKGLPYLAFRFEKINLSELSMREKEQIVNEIKAIGSKIDDIVKQDIFLASAAEYLNLTAASFQTDAVGSRDSKHPPAMKRNINVIESEFLSLLAARPNLIEQVWNDISPEDLRSPEMKSLYGRMILSYRANREINPERLIEQIEDEAEKSALTFLSTIDWDDLDLSGIISEYKQMILNQKREAKIAGLRGDLVKAEKEGNRERAVALTQEIKYLLDKRE